MTHAELRSLALAILAAIIAILLSACAGGPTAARTRSLPDFEMPIAKTDFQTVRTTAYTHTEADHRQFTNHNALGGELHAASTPNRRAENTARPTPGLEDQSGYRLLAYSGTKLQPFDDKPSKATAKTAKTSKGKKTVKSAPPRIGSAAADWSRWPAGTTFRLVSTGQIYKVEDYGWALSGRNTIDLYMATPRDVNTWGVRQEQIQVLHWGDPAESFRLLAPHQEHMHIKRMILEMQGHSEDAAALR